MQATVKVISRSREWVTGKPDIPQRVQVVIQGTKRNDRQISVTKHLRYEGGQYVGRSRDRGVSVSIIFPVGILNGGLTAKVRLAA